MTDEIGLADVFAAADDILAGRTRGRTVVAIGGGHDGLMPWPDTITADEAIRLRMRRLGLWDPQPVTPEQVVGGLVAMQAQEFPYALWSIAQRITPADRPNAADMGVAYDLGGILRTHVMRPTWHFLAPDDARWMLTLTAPRVLAISRIHYRTCRTRRCRRSCG